MKKVAILFVVAVLAPSLVLAWLAVRSLRDQQYILQHQQSLVYQATADAQAAQVQNYLADRQRDFGLRVESLLADQTPRQIAPFFDEHLGKTWPLASVGFVVALDGTVLAPPLLGRPEARRFRLDNDEFLSNRQSSEVYWNSPKGGINLSQLEESREIFKKNYLGGAGQNALLSNAESQRGVPLSGSTNQPPPGLAGDAPQFQNLVQSTKNQTARKVVPQNLDLSGANSLSRVSAAEAEFRQLIGDANEGTLARFVQNKLKLLIWYRSPRDPQLVFGAQLDLPRLIEGVRELIQSGPAPAPPISPVADSGHPLEGRNPSPARAICTALLDDNGKPVVISPHSFRTDWKRPFVASEIGEMLPHWEIAVYLLNPAKLSESATTLRLTLTLIVVLMLLAIGVGGWLIFADLRRELILARQKTDFVSNVSHELKTPLTSIRMFSELLAENRVTDGSKRTVYLNIIAAEAARLARLINNVLDFTRLDRGEKIYHFQPCELAQLVRETVETYRPHLESAGFRLQLDVPSEAVAVEGDSDALAQVLVNLLSNAEKYSGDRKEIQVRLPVPDNTPGQVEVQVLDRGLGVPKGCETRIFEQFFRAHDALASGIQGSGLGLTLAQQIARAHGGRIAYQPRVGGGSCFTLWLPRQRIHENQSPDHRR